MEEMAAWADTWLSNETNPEDQGEQEDQNEKNLVTWHARAYKCKKKFVLEHPKWEYGSTSSN